MDMMTKSIILCLLLSFGSAKAIAAQDQTIAQGVALLAANKIEEASRYFSNVIKKNPDNAGGQHYMGRINYRLSDYEAAQTYFDKSIKLSPKRAEFYVWQGQNYIKLVAEVGFFSKMSMGKKAKAAFEKSIAIDPQNVGGLGGLAQYYLGAPSIAGGSPEKAGELAKKIIALGDVIGNVLQLQVSLSVDEGAVTLADFKKVADKVGDNPKHYAFYNTYGYYLLGLDKHQEAIVQFKKQVELNSTSANAHDSLGDSYYAAKHYELARDAFKQALAIDPDFSHAKKYLKKAEKKIKR